MRIVDLIVDNNKLEKCNVCNLVLANNIQLTSHICSHLEDVGNGEANGGATDDDDDQMANTYISPFDAVTTMCSICNVKFAQPFDLIIHLDIVSVFVSNKMKQQATFKITRTFIVKRCTCTS